MKGEFWPNNMSICIGLFANVMLRFSKLLISHADRLA